MATQVGGSIIWNLDVDDSKFNAGLAKAKGQAAAFGKDVDQQFTGLKDRIGNAFRDATAASQMFAAGLTAVGAATLTAAGFGIKYAADLETMTQGFITLLGSADKAGKAISMIQKDAAQTPFEFKGLVNANFMLTSVTKNAERSEAVLLNIGKALTASGKSGAELDRIIVNLQQIANVGKITELDIRQFGFAGINILELLADYYGTTKEAASEMVKNSKDAFADLEGAFNKAGTGGGRFARAFIDQAGTMNQLWSNFKDNIGITLSQLVKSLGIFDMVKNALKGMVDALSFFASPQGTQQIIEFLKGLQQFIPIIAGAIIGGLVPAFVALAVSMAPILPFIAAGAALGLAIKLLVDAFGGWETVMSGLQQAFNQFGQAFNTYVKPAVDQLVSEIAGNLLPALNELWQTVKPVLIPALQILGRILGGAVILSLRIFVEQLRAIVGIIGAVANAINRTVELFRNLGRYFTAVAEDGDYLNDWLTHLPEILQGPVEAIGRLIRFFQDLPGILQTVGQSFMTFGQTVGTFFVNAFNQVVATITALPGQILAALQALPGLVMGVLQQMIYDFIFTLGFITGLVFYGIPKIVTAIVTFFQELPGKITGVWNEVSLSVTTAFTNIGLWLSTNIPLMIDSVVAFFASLPGRIMFAIGAVFTVIVNGWNAIWGWLKVVVPQIIESVVTFFASLPGRIQTWLNATKQTTQQGFTDIWNAIVAEVSTWPGKLYQWGANIANAFVDGIRSAIGKIVDAFKDGLNKAKAMIEGHSPPIAGPFKDIDKWGFNVGNSWVDGVQKAISNLELSNPFEPIMPAPAIAPVGTTQGGRGIDKLVNIEHMEVRQDSDITDVARELGFRVENSSGFTQNG